MTSVVLLLTLVGDKSAQKGFNFVAFFQHFQIAPGDDFSKMQSWKKWLKMIYLVYTLNMVAISRHLDVKACCVEFCCCGAFGIQTVVTDKVKCCFPWLTIPNLSN
ncbi:hypothetical protein RND81_02G194700 [Saponaria officinalis]|uniref:Secreted protein n=1 Tax=Saponaria officinalis TaxID=3572 RepID=A0AAW1MMU8_SAPOF